VKTDSRKFLALRQKLVLGFVLYNLILVFGVPAVYYGYFYPKESESLEVLTKGIEKQATARLPDLLDPIDLERIERVLPRIIVVRELKYVGVFGPDKKLLKEKFEDEKVIEDPLEINNPVLKDGRFIGSYKLIFTQKYIKEEIRKRVNRALVILLINAILSYFLLMYFLRFVITKQLEDLTNFINSFDASSTKSPDFLEMNKKRVFKDEFDLISVEMNKLVSKVVHQNKQEQTRYNIIESEVYKRTDALLQSKQKADKAVQEKVEFIGSVSHEIRNPINAILGFSDLLSKELEGSDKMELVRPIVDSSAILLKLVNDLLDISKVEVGKLKIEMLPVKISDFIKSLERVYRPKVEGKGIAFNSIIDENFPKFLKIDALRLSQVIANLLENSIKFTKEGFIKISYNHSHSKTSNRVNLKIAVEDTGIGIPKEDWPIIFEKFRQPKAQSFQKYQGSGLGLSICKKITQLMGGDINIVEKTGPGSLFVIDLPEIILASSQDFKLEERKEDFVFEKSKVLVVEDEKINQDLIKWNLKAFPIELIMANNGKEGINLALMHKPDLILMDILMPNMDGIEAIELIKVYEGLKNIPIIVITAIAGPELDNKIKNLVNGILRKPVLQHDLYIELAKFLPHKLKKRELEKTKETDGEDVISETTRKKMEELFLPSLIDLDETMAIEEGSKLAQNILTFAKNNNLKSITQWAETFQDALKKFDIRKIKSLIAELKKKILT
jgi:signal transduction histidine kinase/CheY-like chemotaxis protein